MCLSVCLNVKESIYLYVILSYILNFPMIYDLFLWFERLPVLLLIDALLLFEFLVNRDLFSQVTDSSANMFSSELGDFFRVQYFLGSL